MLLRRATLLSQPENEMVYSLGDYVQGRRKQMDIGGAEKSAGGPGQCPGGGPGGEVPRSLANLIVSKP